MGLFTPAIAQAHHRSLKLAIAHLFQGNCILSLILKISIILL
jgi:hypothetical protein